MNVMANRKKNEKWLHMCETENVIRKLSRRNGFRYTVLL